MTYEPKLERAREIIAQHNEALGDVSPKVDLEFFLANLKAAGGTTTSLLCECSWEDLESYGLPKLLARKIAGVFRGQDSGPRKTTVITEARAAAMTVGELVGYYNPDEDNPVAERLRRISRGKPCVVFEEDGKVAQGMTAQLVTEVRGGHDPRETVHMVWGTVGVFKIGESPFRFAQRNPLYPDKLLRPDGTCSVTERSWDGIPEKVRAVLCLAVTKTPQDIAIRGPKDVHDVLDMLTGKSEEEQWRLVEARFARAAVLYKERVARGEGVSLKVPLRSEGVRRADDPFFQDGQRHVRT